MCSHEAFPEFAVIRDREVEQFVDDDIVAEGTGHGNEFVVEAEGSGGRAGGPLPTHRADVDRSRLHLELGGPFQDASSEFLPGYFFHQIRLAFSSRVKSSSTIRVTTSRSSSSP